MSGHDGIAGYTPCKDGHGGASRAPIIHIMARPDPAISTRQNANGPRRPDRMTALLPTPCAKASTAAAVARPSSTSWPGPTRPSRPDRARSARDARIMSGHDGLAGYPDGCIPCKDWQPEAPQSATVYAANSTMFGRPQQLKSRLVPPRPYRPSVDRDHSDHPQPTNSTTTTEQSARRSFCGTIKSLSYKSRLVNTNHEHNTITYRP